jgi:hypothetical protein
MAKITTQPSLAMNKIDNILDQDKKIEELQKEVDKLE